MSVFAYFLEFVLKSIYPEFCCGCDKCGTLLCNDCFEQLNFYSMPIDITRRETRLDSVIAALEYSKLANKIVKELKYKSVKDVGLVCGKLLYFCTEFPKVDCVSFVPLHPRRRLERGFNQAEIIAQEFSYLSGIPLIDALKRTVYTTSQVQSKSKSERLSKLHNIFAIKGNPAQVTNQSILLIDDVFTTGSTLNECASVLKKAGAKEVHGLVVSSRA